MNTAAQRHEGAGSPGENIRAIRKRLGLTLSVVSQRTGLAVSALSKLEMGQVSLSYDKLTLLSKAFQVDMAELLAAPTAPESPQAPGGPGRRVIQRAGEGKRVETASYKQVYLATELLHKRFTPLVVELRARTLDEFLAEFGALIRHAGEEFVYVLEGELDFHSELYAPSRLRAGDALYFDSEMGHAYIKASAGPCRIVATCAPRGKDTPDVQALFDTSEKHGAQARRGEPAAAFRARKPK